MLATGSSSGRTNEIVLTADPLLDQSIRPASGPSDTTNRPRVLVYHIGSLGDTIVSIPALRALRRHYGPAAKLYLMHDLQRPGYVTPDAILQNTGLIDGYIGYRYTTSRLKMIVEAGALLARLREFRFDFVVGLLPGNRPRASLARDRFFFWLCRIPRSAGFRALTPDYLYPGRYNGAPTIGTHEAICRLERLRSEGIRTQDEDFDPPFIQVPGDELESAANWLRAQRKHPDGPLIAICPGCKKPANAWPLERFVEIGRRVIASHGEVVVVGGPAERSMAEQMVAEWGEGIAAAGRFSVSGCAALLRHCKFLIGLDTGTSHLAAAVGIPCIVVQSANSVAGTWDPLGKQHVIIRASVACAGCEQVVCPVVGHPCMTNIHVDRVWSAVSNLLR